MSKVEIQALHDAGGLTDAEKAALMDEDEQENEDLPGDDDLDDDLDDDGEEDDDLDTDDEDEDSADNDSDDNLDDSEDDINDDENVDDDGDDDEPAASPTDIIAPKVSEVPDIAKLEEGLTAITDEIKELKTRFNEGELDDEEYTEQLEELHEKRGDVKLDIRDAKNAAVRASERIQDRWDAAQEVFYDQPENAVFKDSPLLRNALNSEIDALQSADDFDGNYSRMLTKAADSVRREAAGLLGVKPGDKPGDKKDTKSAKEKAAEKKAANSKKDKPNTLRNKAAAEEHNDDGKFAHLDKLKGRELELALSRMSEGEREAWARED